MQVLRRLGGLSPPPQAPRKLRLCTSGISDQDYVERLNVFLRPSIRPAVKNSRIHTRLPSIPSSSHIILRNPFLHSSHPSQRVCNVLVKASLFLWQLTTPQLISGYCVASMHWQYIYIYYCIKDCKIFTSLFTLTSLFSQSNTIIRTNTEVKEK